MACCCKNYEFNSSCGRIRVLFVPRPIERCVVSEDKCEEADACESQAKEGSVSV